MAKNDDGRFDEMDALKDIPGVDPTKIASQLNPGDGTLGENKKDLPPDEKDKGGADDKNKGVGADDKNKGGDDKNKNVPDQSTIAAGILNEIFGDQYKTVDEVKKLNILDALKERDSLREEVTGLKTQLGKKPKHSFASDDLAKFNEFAGTTGIQSFEVFRKLNGTDIANMDDMDALVWLRVTEDPELSADITRVRKSFERKFNVDKSKIESGDLTQEDYDDNLFEMSTQAKAAKKKLIELKGKIKMPEIKEETPGGDGPKKWTPEVEKKQKAQWSGAAKAVVDVFAKMAIPMKGSEAPIVNFVLPEETKTKLMQDAVDYVVNNQLEISETDQQGNQAKMKHMAEFIYGKIIVENLPLISHAIFERVSGMTEEEKAKQYHNPSKIERKEEGVQGGKSTFEEKQNKAYQLDADR